MSVHCPSVIVLSVAEYVHLASEVSSSSPPVSPPSESSPPEESLLTNTPLRVPLTTRTPNAPVGAFDFSVSVSALKKPVVLDEEYVCSALGVHSVFET